MEQRCIYVYFIEDVNKLKKVYVISVSTSSNRLYKSSSDFRYRLSFRFLSIYLSNYHHLFQVYSYIAIYRSFLLQQRKMTTIMHVYASLKRPYYINYTRNRWIYRQIVHMINMITIYISQAPWNFRRIYMSHLKANTAATCSCRSRKTLSIVL